MFEALAPEIAFSLFVQSFSSASLDAFFSVITQLGNPALWVAVSAALYWKGEEKKSFFLAAAVLFSAALVGILKPVLGRLRPPDETFRVLAAETDSMYSLPSGHAATIASVFGYAWEKVKPKARIAGLAIVLLALLSRVYLGAHYIGDVAVGALFGFLIGWLVHVLEQKFTQIKIGQKKMLEEAGLIVAVALSITVSFALRSLALASGLFGFFAGIFGFKLLDMDSSKLSGKKLFLKEIIGFAGLGLIIFAAQLEAIEPEAYFLAGAWISFIYPLLYEKFLHKTVSRAKVLA